ncbi:hypothetical protein HanIR_Chr07g0321781 [Helianthus annuus]|nr:hypothetical protein HanIR_Chr07g0321781 [Helianthus annuus]
MMFYVFDNKWYMVLYFTYNKCYMVFYFAGTWCFYYKLNSCSYTLPLILMISSCLILMTC